METANKQHLDLIVLACIVCLVLGIFIGREWLKYEIRSAFAGPEPGTQEWVDQHNRNYWALHGR